MSILRNDHVALSNFRVKGPHHGEESSWGGGKRGRRGGREGWGWEGGGRDNETSTFLQSVWMVQTPCLQFVKVPFFSWKFNSFPAFFARA